MTAAKNLLIVLLVLILAFFVFSDPEYIENDIKIAKIDTFYKHDTTIGYKKGDSFPFTVLDTFYLIDSIILHDTPQMVRDFLSVKAYKDTFRIDTASFVSISDTISQNKIIGRSYGAYIRHKTITITNDIYHKPKNELYIGLVGDMRRFDNMIGVGVGVIYKKQNESYILNLTTNQISLGLYKKLF